MGVKDTLGDTAYGSIYPTEPGYKTGDTSQAAAKKMGGRRASKLREDCFKGICDAIDRR